MENSVSSIIEPIIDDILSKVFPPLPEMDEMLLTDPQICPLYHYNSLLLDRHSHHLRNRLFSPSYPQNLIFSHSNRISNPTGASMTM